MSFLSEHNVHSFHTAFAHAITGSNLFNHLMLYIALLKSKKQCEPAASVSLRRRRHCFFHHYYLVQNLTATSSYAK